MHLQLHQIFCLLLLINSVATAPVKCREAPKNITVSCLLCVDMDYNPGADMDMLSYVFLEGIYRPINNWLHNLFYGPTVEVECDW
jgi:hypothetical protein